VIPIDMQRLLAQCGLAPLRLAGRTVLPIVQGGMGIGVSAHRLAGTVASCGAVGTLSSVDLRRHYPDLMDKTRGRGVGPEAKSAIDAANLEALEREIGRARELSAGHGLVAMNVMRAVSDYVAYVKRSLAAGVDAIVVGAGLPLDLPDLAADHPQTALIRSSPIRAACNWWCANGSARSACPTPSCWSILGSPGATSAQRASRT
jgi:nitronate monooxygenase